MSAAEFAAYRQRLGYSLHAWMAEVEAAQGVAASMLVAHGALLSPIVLNDVGRRCALEGRPRCRVLCLVDGASLRMFGQERDGLNAANQPYRFLPMIDALGIDDDGGRGSFGVDLWAVSSLADHRRFSDLFPGVATESVVVSRGCELATFAPQPGRFEQRNVCLAGFATLPSVDGYRPSEPVARPSGFDGVVIAGASTIDNSRLAAVLRSAAYYEAGEAAVATVIFGLGAEPGRRELEALAWDHLGLQNVFFVGPRTPGELAELFNCADVGVFPSTIDGDDQVVIDCLACGTPVIGVESGGGAELISDPIGSLVPDSDDSAELAVSLGTAIAAAINGRWKYSKGPVAAAWVAEHLSISQQVEHLQQNIGAVARRGYGSNGCRRGRGFGGGTDAAVASRDV